MIVKRMRQERGFTQEELARRAGISRVYLAQIEGSKRTPPIRTPSLPMLEKLAKALRVKMSTLLGE